MIQTFIKVMASGFGAGYSPVASGTAGSLVAAVIYWFVSARGPLPTVLLLFVFGMICVPICGHAEYVYGKKDDGHIVLDEFIGMWISLLFLPHTLKVYIAAFLLFRILDVIKPFFIRKVQEWEGGWGVVFDDVFAGIGANLLVRGLLLLPFMM